MRICRGDIFSINNKHYLCIVAYNSKFPIVKRCKDFCADNLIKTCNIIFSDYELTSKIVLTQISYQRSLKTSASDQAYIMQYHHHTDIKAMDRQWHAYNLSKELRKSVESLMVIYTCLLWITSTQIRPGLSSPATHLFNSPAKGLLP